MEVTLTNCDREPVSTPGAIQDFGALFVVNPANFAIVQVSENLEAVTGIAPDSALGKNVSEVLGPKAIEALLSNARNFENDRFTAMIWKSGGMILLEAEPTPAASVFRPEQNGLDAMQAAGTLQELLERTVNAVGEITGLDRVMAYKFHPDLHGEVVAEFIRPGVDSYLGLHYPATDIPVPARAAFLKNWVRMIPDVYYQAVPLKPVLNPVTNAPLDLGTSLLRAVSPIHIDYLKNMRVKATLTISLVVNGKLWGLLACHAQEKKYLSPALRNACESIGRMASAYIAVKDELDYLHAGERYREMNRAMKAHIEKGLDLSLDLTENVPNLQEFIQSNGVASALYSEGDWVCMGDTPTNAELNSLVNFLADQYPNDAVIVTDSLISIFPSARDFQASPHGMLALQIPKTSKNYILWFRPEQIRTVTWAGDPNKMPDSMGRLTPRASFADWKEIVSGKSVPWTQVETDAAEELRNSIMGVDLRRSYAKEQLARQDAERAMIAREELMSVLSHDLKNPIGSIKFGAKVAEKFLASGALPRVQECLSRIDRATVNMDTLINDILAITKLEAGHMDMDSKIESLSDIAAEVIDLLSPISNQADLRVNLLENAERTEIKCDRSRIIQVVSNILGNAIKFTPPAGRIDVRVENTARDTVTISIKDSGPGIPPADIRNIFDRFWQAQQTRKLGTGLGLAIAKGIVEYHRGTIWAESDGKNGTTFYASFPVAPVAAKS